MCIRDSFDGGKGLGTNGSPGGRNDAVRAVAVAPVLDFDKGSGALLKGLHLHPLKVLAFFMGADGDDALAVLQNCLLYTSRCV